MRKTLLILALFIALFQQGYGQSLKQILKIADSTYAKKDFYTALTAYRDALKLDTNRIDIQYKIGESARQFNSYASAARAYLKVLGSKEKAQYPDARLRLGECLHKLADYRNAKSAYLQFIQESQGVQGITPELLQLAKKGAEDCDFALKSIQNEASAQRNANYYPQPVNMGPEINGPFTDYGASYHGDTLYHTSYEFPDPKNKAGRLNKVVKTYPGKAKDPTSSFNAADQHTAYSVFTTDKKGVYYCNCVAKNAVDLRCDIFYRPLDVPGATPIKLGINLPEYTSTSPALGKNTKGEAVLYFASDRPGGKGKLDIWMGAIQADGNVTTASPVAELNTIANDISPFYQEIPGKAQLLFFATDGRKTFGGIDIYGTRLNQTKHWIEPYNLGVNINSSYDDFGYIRDPKGDTLVFSSNRVGSIRLFAENAKKEDKQEVEVCCHDLYKAGIYKLVNLEVNTFKLRDSLALNGTTVKIFEEAPDGTRKELLNRTEADTNHYSTLIERYKKYYIQAQKQGFIAEDSLVLANLGEEESTLVVNLYLPNLRLDVFTLLGPLNEQDPSRNPPLKDCEVSFYEVGIDGKRTLLETKNDPNGNEYNYAVDLGKTYFVKATKPGHSTDTLEVAINEATVKEYGYDVSVDLYLVPAKELEIFLYFDNAKPGPGHLETTTENYSNLYNKYIEREPEFSGFAGQIMRSFFGNSVTPGFDSLKQRISSISQALANGNYVKIYMSGFASPLGNAEYNKRLGARRMVSVINFLGVVQNGVMKKYIDSGQLSFQTEAVGEDPTKPDIPTVLSNVKGEIFGIKPSQDRKVQIKRIDVSTKPFK
jgi:tetratricopeptide (TPR) repeat protein